MTAWPLTTRVLDACIMTAWARPFDSAGSSERKKCNVCQRRDDKMHQWQQLFLINNNDQTSSPAKWISSDVSEFYWGLQMKRQKLLLHRRDKKSIRDLVGHLLLYTVRVYRWTMNRYFCISTIFVILQGILSFLISAAYVFRQHRCFQKNLTIGLSFLPYRLRVVEDNLTLSSDCSRHARNDEQKYYTWQVFPV